MCFSKSFDWTILQSAAQSKDIQDVSPIPHDLYKKKEAKTQPKIFP